MTLKKKLSYAVSFSSNIFFVIPFLFSLLLPFMDDVNDIKDHVDIQITTVKWNDKKYFLWEKFVSLNAKGKLKDCYMCQTCLY